MPGIHPHHAIVSTRSHPHPCPRAYQVMLGEKYKHMQYIGAGVVAVGITIVLAPRLGGDKGGVGTAEAGSIAGDAVAGDGCGVDGDSSGEAGAGQVAH